MKAPRSAFLVAALVLRISLPEATLFAAPRSWTLSDQFGVSVDVRIGAGRPALVIASDTRGAAEEISDWVEALGEPSTGVEVFRVASLKGLPFFVPHGAVVKDLRDRYPRTPILLDWKGITSNELRAPRRTVAVLVFGPDGEELGRVEGGASPSGAAVIRDLLAGPR